MEAEYIKNRIARRIIALERRMESDVEQMCRRILIPLTEEFGERDLPAELLERLRGYFRDIYWSLKVHLMFHSGIADELQQIDELLNVVGAWGGLTNEEMNELPDQDCVVDPGSKLLEMFNDIMDDRGDRGSADYTNRVMKTASDCLSKLTSKNTFKPTVLTRVSHTGRSFIGASIAVSHFLRPICLFHRIINLKQSLGKAIVHFQPLNIPDRQNWLFESLNTANYDLIRSPCQNCNMMFYDDRSGKGWSTFLAECAKYRPVNQLLPDEPNLRQSASHDPLVMNLLRRNHARCSDLFENFLEISNKCIAAARSNDENIMEAVYWEVIYKLHIFGLRPECNPYF